MAVLVRSGFLGHHGRGGAGGEAGMVNPVFSVPYFDVMPRATRVPVLACGGRSQTATDALGSKPLP